MSQTNTGKFSEELAGLFTKTVQGEIHLFNRLSSVSAGAAREFFAGAQRKSSPSVGESVTRFVQLNISCWTAAADHSLGFANDVVKSFEKVFDLERKTEQNAPKKKKSQGKG